MYKYKSNPEFSFNKKSRADSFRLISIISAVLFLSFAFLLLLPYGGKQKAPAFAEKRQAETKPSALMPKLEGDKARDYLKQEGLSDSLGEAIIKARYKVREVEQRTADMENARFEAGNPRNGYHAKFKADGTTELGGGAKDNRWKTSLKLLKFGRGENLKTVAAGNWQAKESRAENRRDSITEWYENKRSGLEHGFTIAEKPEAVAGAAQPLQVAMKIGGNLRARLDETRQALSLGNQVLQYSKLKVLDANGMQLPAKMQLRGKELTIEVVDSKAVYPIEIDPVFEPVKKITASDGASGDFFGVSVSISGDTAIVGADGDDNSKGAAYIFERNTGGANNWGEVKKLTGSGTTQPAGDQSVPNFGYSVSISGDTAIVGMNALVQDSYAWIFERNAGGANNWGEVKRIRHDEFFEFDYFGYAVSVSGDTIIVGANYGSPVTGGSLGGRAYIFERNKGGANNWGQVKMLLPSDTVLFDGFGYSVSISGDTAIVGKPLGDNGIAYIFERNTGGADNWGEVKKITASDGAAFDNFGYSVSISNDIVVIGAFNDDNNKGSAYIYERNTGGVNNWGEVKKLTASDGAVNDQFGISVSISVDTVIVGASGDDSSKGSAYIYERNTGGADNWGQVKKLTASDGAEGDEFGISVSISGDTVIIGASGDDNVKGSAHVFATTGIDWAQTKKAVASDGAAGDFFGYSVSISGDTAIVGATFDDAPNNNQGSAYIFERNQGGANNWGEVKKLTASDGVAGDWFGRSVSISGDTAIVGSPGVSNRFCCAGLSYAYIYERNAGGANNWGEVKRINHTEVFRFDNFGEAVSISGDTAMVGAWRPDGQTGARGRAYIFERNKGGANNWGQVKMLAASDAASIIANFGISVSISGDTAIVGSSGDDAPNLNQGSAYIFERNQGGADNWGEVKKITASDGAENDAFGISVSISGDKLVVGAFGDDAPGSDQGSAYIFERNTGGMNNWGEVKKLTASDGAEGDEFGISVSISVDTVIVGSHRNTNSKGAAYIYERNTGGADNWGQVKKLTASDGADGDEFGRSVAISGDTAIVGALGDDSGKGSAYVFNAVVPQQQNQFKWFYYSDLLLRENVLNQVTSGSNVPIRFSLGGYQGDPYSQPPTSVQISCSTLAPIGAEQVIDRFMPDPYYSSLYDFYQTTWRTKTQWKYTCRRLTLYFKDGTTRSLNFYFK